MRLVFISILAFAVTVSLGCGTRTHPEGGEAAPDQATLEPQPGAGGEMQMPDDDIHGSMMAGGATPGMGINREVDVEESVLDDWAAVKVRVEDVESGSDQVVQIPIGERMQLPDTGLTLQPVLFVPDFVMDESGITSRSADPNNPAVQVIVTEEGQPEYKGWLFAAMPAIHPFPHDRYRVTLVEGVPAG